MKQTLETNRIVTGSLFIIASIAVAFILNFASPFLVPLVIALLIRILIEVQLFWYLGNNAEISKSLEEMLHKKVKNAARV